MARSQSYKDVVRIFVSLTKATREQLGYDESVTFVKFDEVHGGFQRVFDYLVSEDLGPERRFRTVRLITDRGSEVLTGRGTRIWEVVEMLKDESEPAPDRVHMVLKDSWIEDDRIPEFEILRDVREKLKHDPGLHHFLNVECAGVVRQLDSTSDTTKLSVCNLRAVKDLELQFDEMAETVESDSETLTCLGWEPSYPIMKEPRLTGSDLRKKRDFRKHSRQVFREVGTPITRLTSYPALLNALHGALCGTQNIICHKVFFI
jgi:hypothetical protein